MKTLLVKLKEWTQAACSCPPILFLSVLLALNASALAATFFTSRFEPPLRRRCYECHSHEKNMNSGLALDSMSGWEQGGDSGPAILIGKPEESLFLRMVRWADQEHHTTSQ